MKENNIERDIHLLESYAGMTHKMNDNQGRPKLDQAIEHILSDYKRALKENELLRKDIEGWKKYCEEIEEEQTEMSNKNCELEFEIEKLQKENEEWDRKFCNLQNLYFKLQDESESKRKEWQEAYKSEKKMKNEYIKLYQDLLLKENVIPIQKIKDKIKEIGEKIKYEENEKVVIYLHKQKNILQELIEESED